MGQDKFPFKLVNLDASLRQDGETSKSKEQMADERRQKARIYDMFNANRGAIKEGWNKARRSEEKMFTVNIPEDLTKAGLISRDRVADVIRQWAFETYGGRLGLEQFNEATRDIQFRFEEEDESKDPTQSDLYLP